jgi:endonuclease/exonuclease/phosphatase family metal-dependent hydrolase
MKIRVAGTALILGLTGACGATSGSEENEGSTRALAQLPARREHLTVLQYNIAGATRSRGTLPIIERILEEVQARKPDILSLNEICGYQYDHLQEELDRIDYPMHGRFHRALRINGNCDVRGPSDGNAVFVRGEAIRQDDYFFDPTRNQELRAGMNPAPFPDRWQSVACVTARFNDPGAPVKVCVTHLNKKGDGEDPFRLPRIQLFELARVFGPEAQQMPFVLAGDINIPIHDYGLDSLYHPELVGDGPFSEIATTVVYDDDGAGERRAEATHGQDKLDYVFVSRHFAPDVPASGTAEHTGCRTTPCSDHRMLFGAFRWVGSLKVLNSQMCLVARAGAGERPVVQVPCADFSDQAWLLRYLEGAAGPEGPVQVINRDRRLCLVTRGTHESEAVVTVCDAGFPDQVWDTVRDPNTGYYQLKNRNSGLCLVVRTANPETRAIQSTCGAQWADQLWLWDAWFK